MKLHLAKKRLEQKGFWLDMIDQAQSKIEVYKSNHKNYSQIGFFRLEKESLKDISRKKTLIAYCIERYNKIECIKL